MKRLASRPDPNVLLALTCFLGWLFKWHCGANWVGSIQYVTGCYSDAVPFWGLRGVAAGKLPYLEARMEYPVLTGALIWFEGVLTRTMATADATAADFLTIVAAVNAGLAFAVLRMMRRAGVDQWRQYGWAVAPPLVLYVGHNWDMLAVTLAVGAMLAARREQQVWAAALAALGMAAKLFPLLMLPLLGLAALFRAGTSWTNRVLAAGTLAGVAVGAWSLVNLPIAAVAFTNWSEFYAFSQQRTGTAASIWEIAATQGWWASDIPMRNRVALVLFLIGAALIIRLGWRRNGKQAWLLFTPVLAWFLLTNKVYSPQFDLWLYPPMLLTTRRFWPVAWFAIGDVLAYFAEFWWFAGMQGQSPATTPVHIAVAAAIRGSAMLWIIVAAIRAPAPDWTQGTQGSAATR